MFVRQAFSFRRWTCHQSRFYSCISHLADALIRVLLSGIRCAAVRDVKQRTAPRQERLRWRALGLVWCSQLTLKANGGSAWENHMSLMNDSIKDISPQGLPPYRLKQESKSGCISTCGSVRGIYEMLRRSCVVFRLPLANASRLQTSTQIKHSYWVFNDT